MDNLRFPGAAIARSRAARLSGALAIGGGYPLLLALTFLMEVRWSIALACRRSDEGVLEWLDHVNYLAIAEWLCILDIAHRADWSRVTAGRLERMAGLALAIYASVFVAPVSHYLTVLLGVAIAFKFGFARSLRPLSACLALVSLQVLPRKELFGFSLNNLSAVVDAQGAHYLLLFAGYMNDVTGTVVRLRNSAHAIEIAAGCATTGASLRGIGRIWRLLDMAALRPAMAGSVLRRRAGRRGGSGKLASTVRDGDIEAILRLLALWSRRVDRQFLLRASGFFPSQNGRARERRRRRNSQSQIIPKLGRIAQARVQYGGFPGSFDPPAMAWGGLLRDLHRARIADRAGAVFGQRLARSVPAAILRS